LNIENIGEENVTSSKESEKQEENEE